ncbi:hypothetical protein WJX72_011010 [[Myrmecia] bisecta]|uniref:Patatin n=1 Tax=[Myrmecia] bisecta TaxID=41462 RepID=A0AAW1PTZ5_9CHLO
MLGIAHVGATYVYEKAGLRFHSVGGASAGAINAALVVAKRGARPDARAVDRQGLHSGEYFENWITEQLKNGGITNVDKLNDRLKVDLDPDSVTSLHLEEDRVRHLTEDDRQLPNATSGALPTGAAAEQAWKDDVGFEPPLGTPEKPQFPKKITFVDGGVLSNFPINAFHTKDRVPVLPTFGVRFGTSRTAISASYTDINGIFSFLGAMFDSSRHILDREFLLKNPDYCQLITTIDASGFDWLDFDLSIERKVELFAAGAKAAAEFLESFNWQKYKDTREILLKVP